MKLSISMTRREAMMGWCYFLFSLFVLPSAIAIAGALVYKPLSLSVVNIIFFVTNFVCVAGIFHKFLWASLQTARENIRRCLRYAFVGFVLYYAGMLLVSQGILLIKPDFANVNDAAIGDMAQENYNFIAFATVCLVPVAEEVFHRGLVFQGLQRKSRALAYCVSSLVFAGIHVIGYIGLYDWQILCLCLVQYLPAGIALAWAYEKADTIVAPILMHITINLTGILAMR